MAVAIFRDLQTEVVSVRLVAFAARFMIDHASGIMYAFSAGRQDISRGTAPYRESSQTRVSGLVTQFQRASGHGGLDT